MSDVQTNEQKTTVGNYFVSNYPPYSVWSQDRVSEARDAINRPPRPDTPLGLYLHVPFCRKRCHFCYFRVYTGKRSAEIRSYVDAVLAELDLYQSKACIGERLPDFVYFGGGTPSFLSTEQLRTLTDKMKAMMPWHQAREVTFECEPGTLTAKKLSCIGELGVTRLSLGVENFDADILAVNGRAHRDMEIDRAYGIAREVGFPQINIDLIAGMINETDENWAECIRKTIAMAPDSVTIYQMEIPYNTTIYKRMQESGQITAPVADWATKRRWVAEAFTELERAGYTVASAYTAVKDPNTAFVYRDELWRGADLLGLGVASFSHVNGTHYQNVHHIDAYEAALNEQELPIHRALTPTDEERMIREFILQFKLGRLKPPYFRDKFGVDVISRFQEVLTSLEQDGWAHVSTDLIELTRPGLMRIDQLLHLFFLPEHQNTRYA